MSRLGNLYRAGLLVTVPLMLQACGDTNLTLEEALSHTKLSVDELSECFETDPKFEGDSCKGSMVQLRGAVVEGELLLTELCDSPHNRSLEIFALGSRDGENQVLTELYATIGSCVEAIFKLKDGGLVPLFITEVESPELLRARIDERKRLEQERQEAERLAAEEAERLAKLKALKERCVETGNYGEVCLLNPNSFEPTVGEMDRSIRNAMGISWAESLFTERQQLDPINSEYVDADGNPLDFLQVGYDYELAMAHKRIDEAKIDKAIMCDFDYYRHDYSRAYIVSSNTALISERHWYVGYDDDGKGKGDADTSTKGRAIQDGETLIVQDYGTDRFQFLKIENADLRETEERYYVNIDNALFYDERAGLERLPSVFNIDRKTGEVVYTPVRGRTTTWEGKCSTYDGDIKVVLKKLMTDKVSTFMNSSLKKEKERRESVEAERRRREERAKMENKV